VPGDVEELRAIVGQLRTNLKPRGALRAGGCGDDDRRKKTGAAPEPTRGALPWWR
jgi:hypothetical protein